MSQVAGEWVAPADALRGVLIPQVGMRLKDVGKTNLPIDTLVISIAEDGGEAYPVNDKWFDSHHINLQSDRPASFYILTVLRPDCDWTEMVTVRRD